MNQHSNSALQSSKSSWASGTSIARGALCIHTTARVSRSSPFPPLFLFQLCLRSMYSRLLAVKWISTKLAITTLYTSDYLLHCAHWTEARLSQRKRATLMLFRIVTHRQPQNLPECHLISVQIAFTHLLLNVLFDLEWPSTDIWDHKYFIRISV